MDCRHAICEVTLSLSLSRELISLPEHIHRSQHVLEFFRPRPSDKTEEYPPLHKITTLYGQPLLVSTSVCMPLFICLS